MTQCSDCSSSEDISEDANTSLRFFWENVVQLSQSFREYKRDLILASACTVLEVLAECAVPFLTALLIDQIKHGASLEYLIYQGSWLIGVALFCLVFGVSAGFFAANASAGIAKNLRRDMFLNIQRFSFANVDTFSSSSLVTRLTTDVAYLQNSIFMVCILGIRMPITLLAAIIMAYVMAGYMTSIFILVAPIFALIMYFILKAAVPIYARVFVRFDQLNERIEENIHGIREVKSYVREDFEYEKFTKAAGALCNDNYHAGRLIALILPLTNLGGYCIFAFVIYVGSYAIISSKASIMDVGQLSALVTYAFMILMSLAMFFMVIGQLAITRQGIIRICEILSEEPTIANPEHPDTQVVDGSISFENVNFKYFSRAKEYVLHDINLDIPSGAMVGILGATGSAKTSLAQLLARLYDIDEGSLRLGGKDVRSYDLNTLRSAVALVEQKNTLFSGTIAENLRWGDAQASDEELQEACHLACADSFIEGLPDGYQTELSQGAMNLSGGQKQRLCIARAILRKPRVLIFDDSTSAVDTKTDSLIRQNLKSSLPQTTKIIIAQRIDSIKDADLIVVLDRGRIAAQGTHDDLLAMSDIYRQTHDFQSKLHEEGGAFGE